MSSLFPRILSLLLVYRYAALFAVTFLSSLGFPLPSGPSTIAAAAFASQGYLSIFWVMVFGSAGNIGGDFAMYWLVRRYGRKALSWFHLSKLVDSRALQNVEATANTYKTSVIIASRFQVQATAIVNIIAGLGKMNFKRFALLVCVGEILQMIFYMVIGYVFADTWQAIYSVVGKFSWIIALVLTIFFTIASTKIVQKQLK